MEWFAILFEKYKFCGSLSITGITGSD